MLNWAQQFSIFCWLDNHQYQVKPHSLECILAAGSKRKISTGQDTSLHDLQQFIDSKSSWLFGHLNYDLKNEIEPLVSLHKDYIQFPDFFFFEPEILLHLDEKGLTIEAANAGELFKEICAASTSIAVHENIAGIKSRISKPEYISIIEKLQQHILRGDCYEINFCIEFFAEDVFINPLAVYKGLNAISPNPFSAFYKLEDKYLLCASPERFIKKQGKNILSQPIKGTAKRIDGDRGKDLQSREQLYHSRKDRAENVMVVDLVRNDLSKICEEGTVLVEELYGIYSFPQVYQMISTISGKLNDKTSFTDIVRATFPMGSMTGAPKRNVLQLIEKYEKTRRGIFSGALGYISPGGDFDFNVVIRSMMYNASVKYLSYLVGSGITFYSDPEKEWDECLLKAGAIRKLLSEEGNR